MACLYLEYNPNSLQSPTGSSSYLCRWLHLVPLYSSNFLNSNHISFLFLGLTGQPYIQPRPWLARKGCFLFFVFHSKQSKAKLIHTSASGQSSLRCMAWQKSRLCRKKNKQRNKQNPTILWEGAAPNMAAQLCERSLRVQPLLLPLARFLCAVHSLHDSPRQPWNLSARKLLLLQKIHSDLRSNVLSSEGSLLTTIKPHPSLCTRCFYYLWHY